jgi:hypothetical protein
VFLIWTLGTALTKKASRPNAAAIVRMTPMRNGNGVGPQSLSIILLRSAKHWDADGNLFRMHCHERKRPRHPAPP